MIPFTPNLLPIPLDAKASEQLVILNRLKNALIGHKERKLQIIRGGNINNLVELLYTKQKSESRSAEDNSICLQIVSILGALSLPQSESLCALLGAKAHACLLAGLISSWESIQPFFKNKANSEGVYYSERTALVEAYLRSIKSIYCDIVKVVGPRAWGTDVIGASVGPAEKMDVCSSSMNASNSSKGKEKEDISIDEAPSSRGLEVYGSLKESADEALQSIFGTEEEQEVWIVAASQEQGPDAANTQASCREGLKVMLEIYHEGMLGVTPLRKACELIHLFLAGTVRTSLQRHLLVAASEGKELDRIILWKNDRMTAFDGKAREAQLMAASVIMRGRLHNDWLHDQYDLGRLREDLEHLSDNTSPSTRIAALTLQTVVYKSLTTVKGLSPDNPELLIWQEESEAAVEKLSRLLSCDQKAIRAQAAFTLAYLVADNDIAQRAAAKQDVFKLIFRLLSDSSAVDQPYPTPESQELKSTCCEGALLVIACIAAKSEPYRHLVLSANLLPIIIRSLGDDSAGVRAAACHCLRGLARSVNVLRTSLVDQDAANPIQKLLQDGEDIVVQITAAALVSNLVLEFSPMRHILIEQGCINRLCQLIHSSNNALKVNCLWALKNATYHSTSEFKRSMAREVGWASLADMMSSPNEEIAEQALGIIRNITCTYNDDPVTGLRETELGEDRLLSLIEASLLSKNDAIVLQAVYIVVNLATADEPSKLAIMSRNWLLRWIITLFNHPSNEIRSAAVWSIINLAYYDRTPSFRRRPLEIVQKLRSLGVEQKLKRMSSDESLDVRERVRDAMAALASGGGGSGT